MINANNAKKVKGAMFTCNHYSKFDSMIPYFVLFKRKRMHLRSTNFSKILLRVGSCTKWAQFPYAEARRISSR